MRWRFVDREDTDEQAARERVVGKIDAWWEAFARQQAEISRVFSRKSALDLPAFMHQHLHAVDPRLMWEFGPGLERGHRLVITPESNRWLRPMTDLLVARAPKLDGWSFFTHRLAEPYAICEPTIEARTGAKSLLRTVRAEVSAVNQIDLSFSLPFLQGRKRELAEEQAMVAVETLLGEEVLDAWIGRIEVGRPASATMLSGLPALAHEKIEEVRARCSAKPCHALGEDEATWTLWKLEPSEADDCPAQRDLFLGKSMLPAMWQAAHSGVPFDSRRYSRHGEVFCYVKLDGSEGLDAEHFADKSEIEDALDAVLRPGGLGAVVGGGTGRRYSYIDLALSDVDRGIELVRQRLREGNVPERSWVLFFDDAYAAEWVGIWPGSPEPALAVEDD